MWFTTILIVGLALGSAAIVGLLARVEQRVQSAGSTAEDAQDPGTWRQFPA